MGGRAEIEIQIEIKIVKCVNICKTRIKDFKPAFPAFLLYKTVASSKKQVLWSF